MQKHRGDRRVLSLYHLIPAFLSLAVLLFVGHASHSRFSAPVAAENLNENTLNTRSAIRTDEISSNVTHKLVARASLGGDPDTPSWSSRLTTGRRFVYLCIFLLGYKSIASHADLAVVSKSWNCHKTGACRVTRKIYYSKILAHIFGSATSTQVVGPW
jgi:hypothetical protein